ncbi:MAG: DNA alkylation repair protein [Clostridia bacterium]|nr:DNA alkylation repair protein [Clostridia bacterium]
MTVPEIRAELFALRDEKYADFQSGLFPTVGRERVIGVRTPALRGFAKRLYREKEAGEFLACLPHKYFDEDQLHAFVISLEKDFDRCAGLVEEFLPYIGNWATCDQLSPAVFKKYPGKLLPHIDVWLRSDKTYTVRFAIGMLMRHYLDDANFDMRYALLIADMRSDEYYINMMRAWYFATALAKRRDDILPIVEGGRLDGATLKMTVGKCRDSYRIPDGLKQRLKELRDGQLKNGDGIEKPE